MCVQLYAVLKPKGNVADREPHARHIVKVLHRESAALRATSPGRGEGGAAVRATSPGRGEGGAGVRATSPGRGKRQAKSILRRDEPPSKF